VRLRWSPRERVLHDCARRTPSSNARKFTIIEAALTMPASAASIIPELTPFERPKSSALTMSRLGLGVESTCTISADADQIHEHLGSVLDEGDRGRLVAVMKIHRHLRDLEMVRPGNEEAFEIEAET